MNFRTWTSSAIVAIAALTVATGTAHASPAPAPTAVGYTAELVGKDVVTTLDGGFFAVRSNGTAVAITDGAGRDLVVLPLSYNLADREYPIEQRIADGGKTLVMTPVTDVARSVAEPGLLHPVASEAENQKAMTAFNTQLSIATAIGSLVGAGIGAVVGGIVGSIGFVGGPAGILTVLGGIATGGAAGGLIGTLLAGGPTLLVAGINLINTLNAPPGTTRFADK